MIKVLIIDDHTIVREGIKKILKEPYDIAVTGEASAGQEALELIGKNNFDVLILDISLPDMNGIEVLQKLREEGIHHPVLILSMYPEEHYAVRALREGASGYLTKDCIPTELITAIRRISLGRKYITSTLAEKLACEIQQDSEWLPHEKLSHREYQVMRMIATGKTVSEIAEELSLSVKTISTYRTRILEKMNLKRNVDIIHYALKNRLFEIP